METAKRLSPAHLRSLAKRSVSPKERDERASILTSVAKKDLLTVPVNFPIIGVDHPSVVKGTRRADDALVIAVKRAANKAKLSMQDIYEQVGTNFQSKEEAYQLVYRLRKKSSMTAAMAQKWADCLGCKLVLELVPED